MKKECDYCQRIMNGIFELRKQGIRGIKPVTCVQCSTVHVFTEVDSVNHPTHYNRGKIEVIEFIEDQRLGYHLGSVIKYVCRAGRKDKDKHIEDLEKAAWYLKRKIELLRAKRERRDSVRPNEMNK